MINSQAQKAVGSCLLSATLLAAPAVLAEEPTQERIAADLTRNVSQLLIHNPDIAIDLSEVSGYHCFNTGLADGGFMVHFADDPAEQDEEVVTFHRAEYLEKAGLNLENLPQAPEAVEEMELRQWYVIPAGQHDPHHGMKWEFPMIIMADNVTGITNVTD